MCSSAQFGVRPVPIFMTGLKVRSLTLRGQQGDVRISTSARATMRAERQGWNMNRLAMLLTMGSLLSVGAVSVFAQTAADAGTPEAQPTVNAPTVAPLPVFSLEECVAAARSTSPNLKLTTISQDTARAALIQARAENGLALGESGQYTHQGSFGGTGASLTTGTSSAGGTGGSSVNGENFQGDLSLTRPGTSLGLTAHHGIEEGASNDKVSSFGLTGAQTVFDGYPGGRAAGIVQEAESAYKIAEVSSAAAMKNVIYLVRQAYYTLLGDQDTVVLRQATVGQAAENLAQYQGLFTARRATRLDVLQVQVALSQSQLDVRTAQNTAVVDRQRLSLAIGWPLDKQYNVADSPLPDLPSLGPEAALKQALANRPEVMTLAQNIIAAGIALSLQKSQSLPQISLIGSVTFGYDWTAQTDQGAFAAGVSIALPPLIDGGLQNALLTQAADLLTTDNIQQAELSKSITIDVGNALFGVADAKDRRDLAVLNLQQAQGQYDLEKAKLEAGSGTTLDVLTAFSALATARVGLAQAKSSYLLAILNLDSVMGV